MAARLPIVNGDLNAWGGLLNIWLLVAHNPDGTLIVQPFPNPMVSPGDMIVGGSNGQAARLPVGANGLFLGMVGGLPTWVAVPSGFANPMISPGDIIIGTTGGVAMRLGIGAAGQVIGIVSGLPAWVTPPSGFANPMLNANDIIIALTGGTPTRLAVGANGTFLGVSGGVLGYFTPPSGFADPMIANGDMIAQIGGVPARLPIGANGQLLGVTAGLPTWVNPTGGQATPVAGPSGTPTVWQLFDGSFLVLPLSFYSLTGDDATWINAAFNAMPTQLDDDTGLTYTVGTLNFMAGAIYKTQSQINKPPKVNIQGQGATIQPTGTGFSTISTHHGPTSGTVQNLTKSGGTYNLYLDGINAGNNVMGYDWGDGNGHKGAHLFISNFDGSGCIGFYGNSQHFFTEKANFKDISVWNCETDFMATTAVSDPSWEYNDIELYLRTFAKSTGNNTGLDQRAVVIAGVHYNGSLVWRGNMIAPFTVPPTGGHFNPAMLTMLTVGSTAGSLNGHVDGHMEVNGSGQAPFKVYLGDANVTIGDNGAEGLLRFNGGIDPGTAGSPVPQLGQFAFSGPVDECTPLRRVQQPTPPPTGVGYQNPQNNANVYITGGSVTSVAVDGVNMPNNTGPFFVGWNKFITVNYTGTLTWLWVNAN